MSPSKATERCSRFSSPFSRKPFCFSEPPSKIVTTWSQRGTMDAATAQQLAAAIQALAAAAAALPPPPAPQAPAGG